MVRLAHAIGAAELVLLVGLVVVAGWKGLVIGVLIGSAAAVGWLLASRIPQNPLGWMLLFVAGCFALAAPAYFLGDTLADSHPEIAAWFLWYAGGDDAGWIWLPAIGVLFTQVLLRFPDGGLPSPRWRWFSNLSIALLVFGTVTICQAYAEVRPGMANPVANDWAITHIDTLFPMIGIPLLACFLGCAASVVVRYRHGRSVERAQIRWVAWAASTVVGVFIISFAAPRDFEDVLNQIVVMMYALIPIAIGIAVMRYRLYEIDRIVSRSISYALVSAMVVGVYAVVVTSLTNLLPKSGSASVAMATLAAAAVFQPVLRSVRRAVDRRFDRTAYNGQQTADAFGQSLRHQVDHDTVQLAFVAVVERALAPSEIWTWTPPQQRGREPLTRR